MENKANTIWYSFRGPAYEGDEPAFYPADALTWVKSMESNVPALQEEIRSFMTRHEFPSYFNTKLVSRVGGWKAPLLFAWGEEFPSVTVELPILTAALKQIPGMLSCSVSILEPHTTIKEHYGDTNAIIRNHLGLLIPSGLPACGIKVKNTERSWQEGKVLSFCDAHLHSAWNHTERVRVVVIFDVLKEEYLDRKDEICANVLSGLWLQKMRTKYRIFNFFSGKFSGKLRRWQYRRILGKKSKADFF